MLTFTPYSAKKKFKNLYISNEIVDDELKDVNKVLVRIPNTEMPITDLLLCFDGQNLFDENTSHFGSIFNLENLQLVPTALVVYEREAYIGRIDNHERVTIDKNLRSFIYPDFKDLFRDDDLKPLMGERHILELKFDGYMPKWMGRLVHTFKLRAEPIPKYCMGAEAWLANKNADLELRARQGSIY